MADQKVDEIIIDLAQQSLIDAERKFRKSCVQLTLLNKRLEDMKKRYIRAKEANFHRFRYNLRLKLAVMEGVRNMYYEYAHVQAEQVAEIRRHLFGEDVLIVDEYQEQES